MGGLLPPAEEETLMCFAKVLTDSLNHSLIKVFFVAAHSLHIDHGLLDPLLNCLRLQQFHNGIKGVHGQVAPRRLPITIDHLREIQHSLDLSTIDQIMPWAACCVGFGLWAGQVTVNAPFQRSIHTTVSDLQADAR